MLNTSINGTSRSDSTLDSRRQGNSNGQVTDPTTASGPNMLFATLFTADFFRCEVPVVSAKEPAPQDDSSSRDSISSSNEPTSNRPSEAQASDDEQPASEDDKTLYCGTMLRFHKPEGVSESSKKEDNKNEQADSKEQNDPSAVLTVYQPPIVNAAPENQTPKGEDTLSTTVAADVGNPTTDKLLNANEPQVAAAENDPAISNNAKPLVSDVPAQQVEGVEVDHRQQHRNSKEAATSAVPQAQNETVDVSVTEPAAKEEVQPAQSIATDGANDIRMQQAERSESESQQDSGRERPQNRRAERLEEQRQGQGRDSTNEDVASLSQDSSNASRSDQTLATSLTAQATASLASDATLPPSMSTVSPSDINAVTAMGPDLASTAAMSAVASAGATATTGSAQPSVAATVSSTASTTSTEPVGAPTIGASAVTQRAMAGETASNSATSAPRGANPVSAEQPLTEYQQSRLLQRVLKGLERLEDNSSVVRLRLHPPELGSLEMSLHMSQQQLSASINVESEATRQVLQDNLPQLQSKLAERGITVERFDIQVQSSSDANNQGGAFNHQQSSFGNSGSWSGEAGQGRQFGEARFNQIRQRAGESADDSQNSSHLSRYYSGQNLNLHA
jgi:flagellar hook-length control protein FliK